MYIYFPRGGLGLSLSICYSAILTKTSRISRWKHFYFSISDRFASRYSKIFNNYRIFNHHGKHGLRWISPQSQLLICSGKIAPPPTLVVSSDLPSKGLILLQLVGVLAWLVVEPPDKQVPLQRIILLLSKWLVAGPGSRRQHCCRLSICEYWLSLTSTEYQKPRSK